MSLPGSAASGQRYPATAFAAQAPALAALQVYRVTWTRQRQRLPAKG